MQWVGEIQDHSSLKVLVYDGIKDMHEDAAKTLKADIARAQK